MAYASRISIFARSNVVRDSSVSGHGRLCSEERADSRLLMEAVREERVVMGSTVESDILSLLR